MLYVIEDYLTFISLLPTLPDEALIYERYTRTDNEPMQYTTRAECAKMDMQRYKGFHTQFVFPVTIYADCNEAEAAKAYTRKQKWCDAVGCTAHHPSTSPVSFTHYEDFPEIQS